MKTVAAEIQSSTPVTITKAASVLSKFVSADTGASQAVNAYLRRATAALDELVRLHSKYDRKKHKKHQSESSAVTATSRSVELTQGPTAGFENGRKKFDFVINEGRSVNGVEKEKRQGESNSGEDIERRKKKKDKSGEFDEGRVGVEIERKKHKKKINRDTVGYSELIGAEIGIREVEKKRENGLNVEIGELKKEDRKKRKNREAEEASRDEPDDQRSNKKKKRRKSAEDN